MRTTIWLSGAAVLFAAFCIAAIAETPKASDAKGAKNGNAGATQAAKPDKPAVQPGSKQQPAEDGQNSETAKSDEAQELSPDVKEVMENAAKFVKAYSEGDAKAIAAQFTEDAEYIDEQGNVFSGRKEIEETLTKFFKEHAGSTLDLEIDSIRAVGPGVMIEDGTSTVSRPSKAPERSSYTAVHVKVDGKWLVASSRDHAIPTERRHAAHIRQLDWLVGEWIDEDNDSIVVFSCQPTEDGNFLIRDFIVTVAGEKVLSGTQRIGWDPVTNRLRAWTFDSQGGFFEGTWQQDGDVWVLTSHGTTADGQSASATNIFTPVNAHTMTWQAVDQEVDGVRSDDSEVFTLVRRAPALEQN